MGTSPCGMTLRTVSPLNAPGRGRRNSVPRVINSIQSRIISGLILALPIALTFWIIFWLYSTLKQLVLDPTVSLVQRLSLSGDQPSTVSTSIWWTQTDIAARYSRWLPGPDLPLLPRPVRAVAPAPGDRLGPVPPPGGDDDLQVLLSNVFQSLGEQMQTRAAASSRVVLVAFPHPGARSLAFVTNTLKDATTGKSILCVCVLTGVMPPAGFTLFIPEESVTDVGWTVNQALQAILSGGITAPGSIHYFGAFCVPGHGRANYRFAWKATRSGLAARRFRGHWRASSDRSDRGCDDHQNGSIRKTIHPA